MTAFSVHGYGRTVVMGILNVTPDSFSDGGRFDSTQAAVAAGLELARDGADLVDVGGESTRPGSVRVDAEEQCRRVVPVVAELAAAGVAVSVDTTRARVAQAALDAGAVLVNDVSGGTDDPRMLPLVAERDVPYVIMHSRGPAGSHSAYRDVAADVTEELRRRADAALAAGVAGERLVLDPGIGFAKGAEDNWALLTHLGPLRALGFPLLVGVSRKSFLGALLSNDAGPRAATGRDHATAALTAILSAEGVWGVRVHAVAASADTVRVAARWDSARPAGGLR